MNTFAEPTASKQMHTNPLDLADETGETDTKFTASEQVRANPLDIQDENGETALFISCKRGIFDIAKSLIDHGANINICSNTESPLIVASRGHHTNIVELLIENGAIIDFRDSDKHTALDISKKLGFKDIERILVRYHYKVMFINACSIDNIDICRFILALGYNFCNEYYHHSFPLLEASKNGYINIVHHLINSGAKIDMQCPKGQSALMIASENGCEEVVKLLVGAGASLDIVDKEGKSSFYQALLNNHDKIALYLLQSGADSNIIY